MFGPTGIARVVHELSDAQGRASRPVIKWLETPSDAFDHLSRCGLATLLDMGEASFWRAARKPLRVEHDDAERMIELRGLAAVILKVDERDRLLMEPKLTFRNNATAIGASPEAIFQARAMAAQIGWLETSLSSIAAGAVWRVEALLSSAISERSETIRHQLMAFEACEHGLLATWETPGEMICVPRTD